MAWRLSRSAPPLCRRLLSFSSSSPAPSSFSQPKSSIATRKMARASLHPGFRCLATLATSAGRLKPSPMSGTNEACDSQWMAAAIGVRSMSGGGGGGGGKKDEKTGPPLQITEEEWNKAMSVEGYVKRPSAIHDYDEPENYTGRSLKSDEYAIADQENLLTSLRGYEAHPIGPWSWTPSEEIRDPVEAVRQHGPTCGCQLCRRAPHNFTQGSYLTKSEIRRENGLLFEFPEKGNYVAAGGPDGVAAASGVAAAVGGGSVKEESPSWLDSSYPPAYAREIRRLYAQQKALRETGEAVGAGDKKKKRSVWDEEPPVTFTLRKPCPQEGIMTTLPPPPPPPARFVDDHGGKFIIKESEPNTQHPTVTPYGAKINPPMTPVHWSAARDTKFETSKISASFKQVDPRQYPWSDAPPKKPVKPKQELFYPTKPRLLEAKSGAKSGATSGASSMSPPWLNSSHHPAYAKEISHLYAKQQAERPGGKISR